MFSPWDNFESNQFTVERPSTIEIVFFENKFTKIFFHFTWMKLFNFRKKYEQRYNYEGYDVGARGGGALTPCADEFVNIFQ